MPLTARQIDGAAKLVALALAAAIPTERAIGRRLAEADGWPERHDSTGGRSTSTSSVVERVALDPRRPTPLGLERDRERVRQLVEELATLAHALIDLRNRYTAIVPAVTCIGGLGDEWWPEGPSTKCDNVAEEGRSSGLCSACRVKRKRYFDRQAVA